MYFLVITFFFFIKYTECIQLSFLSEVGTEFLEVLGRTELRMEIITVCASYVHISGKSFALNVTYVYALLDSDLYIEA
jgi:hypothetical protein